MVWFGKIKGETWFGLVRLKGRHSKNFKKKFQKKFSKKFSKKFIYKFSLS